MRNDFDAGVLNNDLTLIYICTQNFVPRLEKLNADNAANCNMKTETIQQLTATNESLTRTFKVAN
jgi:hypothetical protein